VTCEPAPRASSAVDPGSAAHGEDWVDIDGPVHYLDFGGPSRGPAIVCVHGLAGSAVNWSALAPLLTGRCRVLAVDLAGHGLTRSGGRSTAVSANTQLLHDFIERVTGTPVILMGNSMGGMISLLEASAAADSVSGVILIDPALPFTPARPDLLVAAVFATGGLPGLGPALLRGVRRLPPQAIVAGTLSLCCHDPSRVSADVIAQHVAVARQRAGFAEAGRDIGIATRSVIATAGFGGHAYRNRIAALSRPVLLLHGERDRLVPVSAARAAARAHPTWSLAVLPGVGHVPQLEAAHQCAAAILSWLDSDGRPAAQAATPPASAVSSIRWSTARRGSARGTTPRRRREETG
jgi:pimeloyl-ACP methyl ester carboxylesterase